MKKILLTLFLLVTIISNSQTTQISYQPSNDIIANPDRGMYYHTSTNSSGYSLLNQTTLTNKRLNDKITLILRVFYLEDFKTSAISQSYLDNMQIDFNRCRNAGVKAIVRFAYNSSSSQTDASKTIVLQHINQLSSVINENKDVIVCIQAGFIGSWGEGYYTTNFGNAGNLTNQNIIDRNEVLKAELDNFNSVLQVRTPLFKTRFIGDLNPLTSFEDSYRGRIGHHNDSFLSSNSEQGTYSNVAQERAYVKQDSKFTPVGGEANEYPTAYTDNVLTDMDEYNYTYFNSVGYASGIIADWDSKGWLSTIKKKLGYRFNLKASDFTINNNTLTINIQIRNEGFTTPFRYRKVYLMLNDIPYEINTDIRTWTTELTISTIIDISNLSNGIYNTYLYLPDNDNPTNPNYAIQLANVNTWEQSTGFNKLNYSFEKTDLGVNTINEMDSFYYEDSSIVLPSELEFGVYNMLGQKVYSDTSDKIKLGSLQKGIYIVKFKDYKSIKIVK